jgi:hypothetical protein
MKSKQILSVFRIFSAFDWNQSESNANSLLFALIKVSVPKTASIFFSNAEKLRKSDPISIENTTQESSRTLQNIGLIILFPIIPVYFNVCLGLVIV